MKATFTLTEQDLSDLVASVCEYNGFANAKATFSLHESDVAQCEVEFDLPGLTVRVTPESTGAQALRKMSDQVLSMVKGAT